MVREEQWDSSAYDDKGIWQRLSTVQSPGNRDRDRRSQDDIPIAYVLPPARCLAEGSSASQKNTSSWNKAYSRQELVGDRSWRGRGTGTGGGQELVGDSISY